MKAATYPRIELVEPLPEKRLYVRFVNGDERVYACGRLLKCAAFRPLEDDSLFRKVKVDPGGYGVSWTDAIDLSESELWLQGKVPVASVARVAEPKAPYGARARKRKR